MSRSLSREGYEKRFPPFHGELPYPLFFRLAHLEARSTYPVHAHQWGEFVYSYSGVTEVRTGQHHLLAPPHLGIWIPPGVQHVGFSHYEAVHCSIYVEASLSSGLPTEISAVTVTPLLRALLDHLRASPPDHATSPGQRLLHVLVDLLEACPTAGSFVPGTDDPMLSQVLEFLRSDPSNEQSVTELAAAFYTSERTLLRRSKQQLGMPLSEWRQRLKVTQAIALLQEGRSVEVIALDLGYSTASAFIAMFKRLVGVSPARFSKASGEALRS